MYFTTSVKLTEGTRRGSRTWKKPRSCWSFITAVTDMAATVELTIPCSRDCPMIWLSLRVTYSIIKSYIKVIYQKYQNFVLTYSIHGNNGSENFSFIFSSYFDYFILKISLISSMYRICIYTMKLYSGIADKKPVPSRSDRIQV